jgi:hypothetical protein
MDNVATHWLLLQTVEAIAVPPLPPSSWNSGARGRVARHRLTSLPKRLPTVCNESRLHQVNFQLSQHTKPSKPVWNFSHAVKQTVSLVNLVPGPGEYTSGCPCSADFGPLIGGFSMVA